MKKIIQKNLSGGTILLVAVVVVNICNFLFNAYLGRSLSFEQFGLVTLLNTLWYVALIPFNALYITVNHHTAYLVSKESTSAGMHFLNGTNTRFLIITIIISLVWVFTMPLIDEFFQIHDYLTTLLFTPVITLGVITAINKGFLQGVLNFKSVAYIIILEAVSKLLFAVVLVNVKLNYWVYLTIPLSVLASFLLSLWITKKRYTKTSILEDQQKSELTTTPQYMFPKKFFGAALITGFSSLAFLTFDLILVKHFLSPTEAGKYAFLSLIGKMVYFFGALPSTLIITFVSRDIGRKLNPNKTFYKLFSLAVILTVGAFIGVGPMGRVLIPILFGKKTFTILPYLNIYAAAIMFFTLSSTFIGFQLARQRYLFPVLAIILAAIMCIGIITLHNGINQVIHVIFYTGLISLFIIATLHILVEKKYSYE